MCCKRVNIRLGSIRVRLNRCTSLLVDSYSVPMFLHESHYIFPTNSFAHNILFYFPTSHVQAVGPLYANYAYLLLKCSPLYTTIKHAPSLPNNSFSTYIILLSRCVLFIKKTFCTIPAKKAGSFDDPISIFLFFLWPHSVTLCKRYLIIRNQQE